MRKLVAFFILISVNVQAETSLWQLTNGESTLYLGGTVHVLSKADYPLPAEFEQAYQQAEKLVLETDLTAMNQPDTQLQLMQLVMFPPEMSLQTALRPETYAKLKTYCASRGIDMLLLDRFRPSMVVLMLTVQELTRLKMGDVGVDNFFNHQAVSDGKSVGQLETVQTQIEVIANMGKGHEDELILNTLEEMKTLPNMMAALKAAWRAGDLDALDEVGLRPMREQYPAIYHDLLVKRNQAWLPKIEALLATPETELILVGALHLVSQDGLLAQLKQRGYQVKRF